MTRLDTNRTLDRASSLLAALNGSMIEVVNQYNQLDERQKMITLGKIDDLVVGIDSLLLQASYKQEELNPETKNTYRHGKLVETWEKR